MPVLCTLEDANSTKIQNAVLQQCTDCSIFSSVKLQHKGLIIFAKKKKRKRKEVRWSNYLHDPLQTYVGEFMSYLVLNKSKVANASISLSFRNKEWKKFPPKAPWFFGFPQHLKICTLWETVFKKSHDSDDWEFTVNTPGVGTDVKLNGSEEESGSITALFGFITK